MVLVQLWYAAARLVQCAIELVLLQGKMLRSRTPQAGLVEQSDVLELLDAGAARRIKLLLRPIDLDQAAASSWLGR